MLCSTLPARDPTFHCGWPVERTRLERFVYRQFRFDHLARKMSSQLAWVHCLFLVYTLQSNPPVLEP